MKHLIAIIAAAALLVACGNKIPESFDESRDLPRIYPDYVNVTVPINIAPLTFEADAKAEGIVARLTAAHQTPGILQARLEWVAISFSNT